MGLFSELGCPLFKLCDAKELVRSVAGHVDAKDADKMQKMYTLQVVTFFDLCEERHWPKYVVGHGWRWNVAHHSAVEDICGRKTL